MITLAVTYVVNAGREAEAEGFARELIAASRLEPGCRAYDVNRAKDDEHRYLFYERYDDEAALEAHRSSPHFERFGRQGLQTVAERRDAVLYVPLS